MEKYYLHLGSEQKGPYTLGQLQEMWRTGAVNLDTQFYTKAGGEWKAMEAILHLLEPPQAAAPFAFPNPPAAAPLPSQPAAPVSPPSQAHSSAPARTSAIASAIPQQATHIVIHQPVKNHRGLAKAAWILLFIVCGVSLLPFFGFASWLFAGPVFLVVFILSIMVLSRGGTLPGMLLLLSSIIFGPIFVTCAPVISSFVGLGAAGAAVQKNERAASAPVSLNSEARSTTNSSPAEPVKKPAAQVSFGIGTGQSPTQYVKTEQNVVHDLRRETTAAEREETKRREMEAARKKEMRERIVAEEAANMAQMSKLLWEGARFPGRITNAKNLQSARIVMRVMARNGTELTAVFENPDKATETRLMPGKIEFSNDTNSGEEKASPAVANLKTTDQKEIVVKNDGTPIPLKLSAPAMFYLVPGTVRLSINSSGGLQGEGRFVSPEGLNPYVLSFDGQPAAVSKPNAESGLPDARQDPRATFLDTYFQAEKNRDWAAVMKKFAPNVQIVTLKNGKTLRDVRMGQAELLKEKKEDAEQWPVQRQSIDSEVRIKPANPPYSTVNWRMTNRCENPRLRKWNQNQTDITLTIEVLDDRFYITRVETAILESSKGEMQNKPAGQTATPPVRKPPGFILKFQ
jgi:hypothetical protein